MGGILATGAKGSLEYEEMGEKMFEEEGEGETVTGEIILGEKVGKDGGGAVVSGAVVGG